MIKILQTRLRLKYQIIVIIKKPREESLEFNESDNQANARYEKLSMISVPKDVPTTPSDNSFEQKTPSETFLSLDRISTEPINKNTPTTNKSEALKNDGGTVFTDVKKNSPLFSRNAQKLKQYAAIEINS